MVRADRPGGPPAELNQIVAGRYRLTGELARGGMGEVFAALDQSTGQRVALKRMLPAALQQRSLIVHFMREYHALAELRHPRIIEVFDYGMDHGVPYYTMELLDGQDLRDLSPLPYREACAQLRDVASSLALLHARRLLHRDLSPRNVRRTSDGRCKLLDFGAMVPFGIPANVTGTAPCLAPEALQGGPLDQRSDLYSFGALAYCVLTGRHAYAVANFDQLPAAWKQAVVRPRRRVRELPEALDELVMSLLSLDPMKRPTSAAEVIDWLSAIGELPRDDSLAAARSFLTSSHIWGRDLERVELSDRLARALQGDGGALLIQGETGLGKSRLLAEAALVAQTCGLTVVRLVARRQRGASATLVSDLVLGLRQAAPLEAQNAATRRPQVLAQLRRATGMPEDDDRSRSGELQGQLLGEVTDYVREIARERPLLITVDDLDRADDFSASLIAALAHTTHRSPHVVIATHTGPVDREQPALAAIALIADSLELQLLERRHSDLLVASLFGDIPNIARVADWLYRVAHGNPKLTLELAELLMSRGVVRYSEGTWVVATDEITEPLPSSMADAMMLRLSDSSTTARELAELCCVRRGGVSAEHCLVLVELPPEAVFRALEELVRGGVLESVGGEYAFAQEVLRKALQLALSPERSRELHGRWARLLLARRPQTLDIRLEAGWHLVHTEQELRGADLLARVGPELVNRRVGLAAAVPAIEKALAVYAAHDRPRSAQLHLRAMLTMCSYLFDYRLAERYGARTLAELYACAGLPRCARLSKRFGNRLGFVLGVLIEYLRWLFLPRRTRGPNVLASTVYFVRTAMGLLGVRATALDVAGTRAIAELLRLFEHAPLPVLRTPYLLSKAIALQSQGREGEVQLAAQAAIDQLAKPALGMSAQEHADLLGGALLVAGINETYREHSKALEYAARLERLGTPVSSSAAQRVSMTYYLLRGDRERTQHYRRALDLNAIQGGTIWQVEWFAVPIEGMAGAAWTDLIALRRSLDRLEHLVKQVPSLAPMRDGISIAYHFRRGEFAQAAALGLAYTSEHAPRTIIGWASAYAVTALSLVELDEPERALVLTERAQAAVSDEDRCYFVMYAALEAAHATALAVLGQRARAEEIFRVRLARLRASGEHVRAFIIHEYRTKVARLVGDRVALLEALQDMREAALASGNPVVIARADRVNELGARQRSSPLPPANDTTPTVELRSAPTAAQRASPAPEQTAVSLFLRECRQPELRAQHALRMLGQYATSGEGYLYWVVQGELQLAASLDPGRRSPPGLQARLLELLADGRARVADSIELTEPTRRYRVLWLSSEPPDERRIGLAVLRETESAIEAVPQSLVAEIGRVLRAAGTGLTQHPSAWPKA